MTEDQILELAETCGITPNKYKVCIIWKHELLKFAQAIRTYGWDEGYEYATEIHKDEINLLREELKKLGKVL